VQPPEAVAAARRNPRNVVKHFTLVRELGAGAVGAVFQAWDGTNERWVALKLLPTGLDETSLALFRREARLAAGLDHPNLASVYEAGEWNDRHYLSMRFVDGRPLDRAFPPGSNPADVAAAVRDAARGVAHAHARGIIHRDLKPANVLIDGEGRVSVLDFGLAKSLDSGDQSLTAGDAIGTPAYMAPEQARGEPSCARTDVFALGAILWHLLGGHPPRTAESTFAALMNAAMDPIPPITSVRPDVPGGLGRIVSKAVSLKRDARYANAGELADALDIFLGAR